MTPRRPLRAWMRANPALAGVLTGTAVSWAGILMSVEYFLGED